MSTDAAGRNHQPAGAPVGGQFATGTVPETGTTLARPLDPLVGDLGIEPGDTHFMSAFEAGTDIFQSVEIIHDDEGGYRAQGSMPVDFVDAAYEVARFSASMGLQPLAAGGPGTDEQVAAAETYLNDNAQLIESFLTDRYGLELDGGADTWAAETVTFTVQLDPAVDTAGSVASRLENETQAVGLYNETDAGTFGSPYVWRELAEHVDRWEADVAAAERAFVSDVYSDQGLEYSQADCSPEERTTTGADAVRAFMAGQHDQIEQARRAAPGVDYTAAMLGRDISLAINNPAGTPHARLAFGAFPEPLQVHLQRAARAYGGSSTQHG